jgi:hypothetical protein
VYNFVAIDFLFAEVLLRKRAQHDTEDDDMFAELQEDFGEEEVDGDEVIHSFSLSDS